MESKEVMKVGVGGREGGGNGGREESRGWD